MSQSRSPSSTSSFAPALWLGAALGIGIGLGAVGCGPGAETCGPAGAPESLVASGNGLTLTYGQFTGRPNNDCPASGAPKGLVSLTITGMQTDAGGGGFATLCVGRPDQLASQSLELGTDAAAAVHFVDLNATTSGCTFKIDRTQPLTGTASATGLCDSGTNPAGFTLVLDAALTLTRTCGATVDTVPVSLHGKVAVSGP